jgi:hypothetical protein
MYAELWHASHCVLKAAGAEPQGAAWQCLSSIVFTAFTLEAFVNHVGASIFSCWDELERLPPWAKLLLISEKLDVRFAGGSGARPLQTISELLKFRNTMAHAKPNIVLKEESTKSLDSHLDHYLGEMPMMEWERLIKTDEFALRAREDVKRVCEAIHAARPEPKEHLFTFGMGLHGASLIAD